MFRLFLLLNTARSAANTGSTASNTAEILERAAWTEEMKAAYQVEQAKRRQYLAGQNQFILMLLGGILLAAFVFSHLNPTFEGLGCSRTSPSTTPACAALDRQ